MLRTAVVAVFAAHGALVFTYFVLWGASQLALSPLAALLLWRHERRHTKPARAVVYRLADPPLVSVVVPAFNEAHTIVESVRALLALDYKSREIVVVNDGSSDNTLPALREAFDLVAAPLAIEQPLQTACVRAIYRSISEVEIVVVDKENGGSKADAANAGINAASGELVLCIDADTLLEPDALSRAVIPFLEDPTTVAVGGNVAIVNGRRVEAGRMSDVGLPGSWLARLQTVEYMRSFLLFRLACASLDGVVLISGAFGLFRRDAVLAVGGYDPTAIGEDMDLTIRLQEHFRARRKPFHIAFDPNPLAWTMAPEDWRSLRSQRLRWRRGLLQVLWRHRRMIGRPRYGAVGVFVLPYILICDGLGPILEISGYVVTAVAALSGLLDWQFFRSLVVVSVLVGASVTLFATLFSDVVTRQYDRRRRFGLLILVVILEACGYRQINSWWGCVGTVQAMSGKRGWGVMKRRAF